MPHVYQPSFSDLAVDQCQHPSTESVHNESSAPIKKSKEDTIEPCLPEDEPYTPINFIQPEIYAMIAAWEQDQLSFTVNMHQSTSNEVGATFEPLRRVESLSAPKRFYRRFWWSTTKQLLKRSRASSLTTCSMETDPSDE